MIDTYVTFVTSSVCGIFLRRESYVLFIKLRYVDNLYVETPNFKTVLFWIYVKGDPLGM